MTQPVFIRHGVRQAVISVLESVVPAAIAVGNLYVIVKLQGVEFTELFVALAAFVGALCFLGFRSQTESNQDFKVEAISLGWRIIFRWIAIVALLLLVAYASKFSGEFARRAILPWIVSTPVLIWMGILSVNALMRAWLGRRKSLKTAVIAGVNGSSLSLARELREHPELGIHLEGMFDDRSAERVGLKNSSRRIGGLPEMADYVRENNIDVVFIALPIREIRRMMDQIDNLRDSTASIYYVPDVFVFNLIQSQISAIQGIPVVAMCETPMHGYQSFIKRTLDVVMTSAIILAIAPILAAIAIAVKVTSPGPIIFKQRRYGLDGKEIIVYKFRSMKVQEDGEKVTQATKNDSRLTSIGGFIRRHSLDELPQLFNVLEGKMSLVGPRPHAVAHNEEYRKLIKGYMVRHKVLPGITGLAQVNGCRGETEKVEKMEARVHYDMDYLRHWTPLLDIKIILLTIVSLLRKDSQAY